MQVEGPISAGISWIENFEIDGRFPELISHIQSFQPTLSLSERAAYARALALVGQVEKANEELNAILGRSSTSDHTNPHPTEITPEMEPAVLARVRLAQAKLARIRSEWERAIQLADEAHTAAIEAHISFLEGEALFAKGIALVENGKIFLGAEIFQQIRNQPKFPPFRRGLAAYNAACILWDLGQTETLERFLPEVPRKHLPRIEIVAALLNGKTDLLADWIQNGPPEYTDRTEWDRVTFHLTEAILVYRDQVCTGENLTETWFFRAVNQMLDSGAERSMTYAKAALHFLKIRDFQKELDNWITAHQSADWRMLIELRTLEFLSGEFPTSALALEFWRTEIQERAEKHLIASPLATSMEKMSREPQRPWNREILQKAGLLKKAQDLSSSSPRFVLNRRNMSLDFLGTRKKVRLPFQKSPASWKVLTALSGPAGHSITKKTLHEQLTTSAYNPRLHDSRLHKLLERLARRFTEKGLPCPWNLPGDNRIHLISRIEVSETL